MKKRFNALCSVALVGIFAFASIASGSSTSSDDTQSTTTTRSDSAVEETVAEQVETTTEAVVEEEEITFGSTVIYDNLEITFGDSVDWTTLDNQFSDLNGSDVIVLPIHVKNVGEENNHLNIFAVTVYGSTGVEVDELGTYYDDGLFGASDLRPGAEQDVNIYIQYDGDGTYYVDFGVYNTDVEASFDITK